MRRAQSGRAGWNLEGGLLASNKHAVVADSRGRRARGRVGRRLAGDAVEHIKGKAVLEAKIRETELSDAQGILRIGRLGR